MKQRDISKNLFSPEQMASAFAAAGAVTVNDSSNPSTKSEDWNDAIVSHSLNELREKLAIRRRGQQKAPTKVVTTIRLDADVLEALRASGKGWQSRVNDALRDWVKRAA